LRGERPLLTVVEADPGSAVRSRRGEKSENRSRIMIVRSVRRKRKRGEIVLRKKKTGLSTPNSSFRKETRGNTSSGDGDALKEGGDQTTSQVG